MLIEHQEAISSKFEGTIIDIETVGYFLNQYPDSRRYQDIRLVIFGFINSDALHILCARGVSALDELRARAEKIVDSLEGPFYAFNTEFERCVLFYELGKEIFFDRELNREKFEAKADSVSTYGIPNYDDPFNDNGYLCMKAWEKGQFDKAIAHNRACLLKEKDILLKRGFRKPDGLPLVKQQ